MFHVSECHKMTRIFFRILLANYISPSLVSVSDINIRDNMRLTDFRKTRHDQQAIGIFSIVVLFNSNQ